MQEMSLSGGDQVIKQVAKDTTAEEVAKGYLKDNTGYRHFHVTGMQQPY